LPVKFTEHEQPYCLEELRGNPCYQSNSVIDGKVLEVDGRGRAYHATSTHDGKRQHIADNTEEKDKRGDVSPNNRIVVPPISPLPRGVGRFV